MLLEDVDAAGVADPVRDPGADEVRHRTDHRGREQAVFAARHVEAGEQHGGLAGHRDAGRLEEHQDEHSRQPHGIHDVHGHLDYGVGYRGEHYLHDGEVG